MTNYSFLPIKKITLSPLGNGILGTFKKKFYETWYCNCIGISKEGKVVIADFFEMPQDGH